MGHRAPDPETGGLRREIRKRGASLVLAALEYVKRRTRRIKGELPGRVRVIFEETRENGA